MSKQRITAASKRARKQERREEERRQEMERARRRQSRRTWIFGLVITLAVLAGVGIFFLITRPAPQTTQTAGGSSPASSSNSSAFAPVNGVSCDNGEHYDYHHHIHVSMYINGQAVAVPQNIGINTNPLSPCLYWLHTHDTKGIIHIESPVQRTYTLGDFFAVWSSRFAQLGYPAQLNQASGWQIYVNGQTYKGDFRSIPLESHTLITMAYNSPGVKPDTTYNWGSL